MRQNRFIAIAALLALLPSLAFALKPLKTVDCEIWKDSEIRCLLNDSKHPTATINLKNKGTAELTFTVDEWHSVCGWPGGKVESNTYSNVAPGTTRPITPQAAGTDSGGRQITCREIFVANCKEGNTAVNCKDKIEAKYTLWIGNKQ